MSRPFFREYDIRGRAAELTNDVAHRVGLALAHRLRPTAGPPRIVLARDPRLSSPRLHAALVAGLVAGEAQVLDLGVGPSPLLYFAVHHLLADGGVVITGSHNPPHDNGFKLLRGSQPLHGEELRQLDDELDTTPAPPAERGTVSDIDVTDAYIERVTRTIGLGERRPRVVVDGGNGAAGPLGVRTLRALGLDPIPLFCEPDGRFPHRSSDPTSDQLGALRREVVAQGADLGLAWDGDGDRLGVIDRDGAFVWADRLLTLFARQVLRENPGAIVLAEVKCSQTLFDEVKRCGGEARMTPTGHSHLKLRMKEDGALLGGEISGHLCFADRYLGFDDAIYAGLRLVEIIAREGRSVGELLADLPHREITPEIRVDCPDHHKKAVVELVRGELSGEGQLIEIDGVRVAYEDGAWGLVRASNTAPLLVLRFEAPTMERLEEIRTRIEAVVHRAHQRVTGASS